MGAVGLDLRAVGRCCSLAWGGLLVAGQMSSPRHTSEVPSGQLDVTRDAQKTVTAGERDLEATWNAQGLPAGP